MSGPRLHVAVGVALLALLVASVVPYAYVVDLVPQSRDAILWLTQSDPGAPGFAEWTFRTQHFRVGYRPGTALSFTLGYLLVGLAPELHRAVDLGLHASCVGATFLLGRRLARWTDASDAAAHVAGLAAAAVVGLHPVAEYVVTQLARRSYPLATALLLGALLLVPAPDASVRARWGRGLAAATLVAASALCHEVGYLGFGLAALVALGPAGQLAGLRRQLPLLGASAAWLGALLAVRVHVVQGVVGGYGPGEGRAVDVLIATVYTLLPIGGVRLETEPVAWVPVAMAAVVLGWLGVVAATTARRDPGARLGALWLAGLVMLFLPQGVWFARQIYAALPGLGLLVGAVLVRPVGRIRGGVPAAAALGIVVASTPLWGPHSPDARASRVRSSAMMREVADAAATIPARATALLAVPRYRYEGAWGLRARDDDERNALSLGTRVAAQWAERVSGRRVAVAVLIDADPADQGPLAQAAASAGQAIVRAAPGHLLHVTGAGRLEGPEVASVSAGNVRRGRGEVWLILHDGATVRAMPLR